MSFPAKLKMKTVLESLKDPYKTKKGFFNFLFVDFSLYEISRKFTCFMNSRVTHLNYMSIENEKKIEKPVIILALLLSLFLV